MPDTRKEDLTKSIERYRQLLKAAKEAAKKIREEKERK